MSELTGLIASAIGLMLLILMAVIVGRVVLAPINRMVQSLDAPRRFQLSDLISLMLLMQVLLATLSQIVDFNADYLQHDAAFMAVVFPAGLILLMWGGGISYISQA